jgi:mannosyltransferase
MRPRWLAALGVALALAALVPSQQLVRVFRPGIAEIPEALLQGAMLFRIGLTACALACLLMARFVEWRTDAAGTSPSRRWPPAAWALLAVALALRLYALDEGIWYDEIVAIFYYVRLPLGECLTTYVNENQQFVFTILAHWCFVLFGEHTWALRLPAALFGVASIGALYALARRVTTPAEALLAAALMTFSYHHVWFSQNGRGYTGLLFWTILASTLLLRAFDDPSPRRWLAYGLAAALGVYTHLTMIFAVAGHLTIYAIWLLARSGASWRRGYAGALLGFGAAGLITFQLYAIVIPQMRTAIGETISWVEEWKNPLWTLAQIVSGLHLGFVHIGAGLAALAVAGAGVWSYLRSAPAVVGLAALPAMIGAGYVIAVGHHLWPRFFFFVMGFAVLIAVRGVMVSARAIAGLAGYTGERWGVAACILLIALSAASLARVYGPKQDYEGPLAFVESNRQPGDEVVTAGLATWAYRAHYHVTWGAVEKAEELEAVRARAARTWVVSTLEPVLESMHPDVARVLQRDFKLVRRFPGTLQNGEINVRLAGP